MYTGPHLIKDNLVFGYDTGYGVADNNTDTRLYSGKPSTNLLGTTGEMLPPDPETPYDLTVGNSTSNINGTTWDLSLYNSTSLASDNGVAWHPNISGPGFKGAWRLKKRPGSNWETQFQNGLGTVSNTTAIVLSVWCKTTVSGVARINANTTRNGSSNWGNSSAYHSGSGKWERLSYVIPASSGVTSINVIRCQVGGTTLTTDVYWRRFQIEYGTTPTPFLTGTRSSTQSLIDLKRTANIDVSNVSFDSTGQPDFDGTDDHFTTSGLSIGTPSSVSFETVIKFDGTLDSNDRKVFHWDKTSTSNGVAQIRKGTNNGRLMYQHHDGTTWYTLSVDDVVTSDTYIHILVVHSNTTATMYKNGVQVGTGSVSNLEYTNAGEILIGYRASSEYWKGGIPIFRVYNNALSAEQVKQNYNAYKNRFGI